MSKILGKFAKANNNYSNFYEVTAKHFSFRSFVSDVIHNNLKLKCFGVTSHKPLQLLFASVDLNEIWHFDSQRMSRGLLFFRTQCRVLQAADGEDLVILACTIFD